MTTTLPPQLTEEEEHTLSPTLSSLSTLSTLWIPLDETIQQWAAFAQEAITVPALLATSTAFYGLAWEAKALRHYTWACHERKRQRTRKEAHWLERAVATCAHLQARLPGSQRREEKGSPALGFIALRSYGALLELVSHGCLDFC